MDTEDEDIEMLCSGSSLTGVRVYIPLSIEVGSIFGLMVVGCLK